MMSKLKEFEEFKRTLLMNRSVLDVWSEDSIEEALILGLVGVWCTHYDLDMSDETVEDEIFKLAEHVMADYTQHLMDKGLSATSTNEPN